MRHSTAYEALAWGSKVNYFVQVSAWSGALIIRIGA